MMYPTHHMMYHVHYMMDPPNPSYDGRGPSYDGFALYHILVNGEFSTTNYSRSTSTDIPMICEAKPQSFLLRGLCKNKNSQADVYFILVSPFEFKGYINTKIIHKQGNWLIVSTKDNSTIASTNDTRPLELPLGIRKWYFTDKSCQDDDGQNYRSMNLHLEVEQPGTFCCNDGSCLPSIEVCNGSPVCKDKSCIKYHKS